MEKLTGFNNIDNSIGGLINSDLICIASNPNTDKRILGYNIAINLSKQEIPTIIFSLDENSKRAVNQIINIECANSTNIRETSKNLLLIEKNIFVCDEINSISEIERISKNMKYHMGIGLIVIDYLQLIQDDNQCNRKQQLEDINKRLKKLAKQLEIPIIVISEIPKESEQRENRPTIADLSNYNISKYADNIIFTYRDDYYNEDTPMKDIVEIIIAKSKSGDTGTEELINVKTRYINLEKRFEEN